LELGGNIVTPGKWFAIGGILIGAVIAIVGFIWPSPLVAQVGGIITGAYSAVGTVIFGPAAAAQTAIGNIEDPAVKAKIVEAVSKLPGVDGVQLNKNATPDLLALGGNASVPKVFSPKA